MIAFCRKVCNLPGKLNVFHLSSFERHFARLGASILYFKRFVFYQMCLIVYKQIVIKLSPCKIWTLEWGALVWLLYQHSTGALVLVVLLSWWWGACLYHKRELCDNIADAIFKADGSSIW